MPVRRPIIAAFGFLSSLAVVTQAEAASQAFNLQLVSLCEGAALCDPPGIDVGYLQSIYTQIDINVNVLSTIVDNDLILQRNDDSLIIPTETNSSGQLTGGALFQFTESFSLIPGSFGPFAIDPNTVYMGFTGDLAPPTLGVAFVDAPTAPFGIVENTSVLEGGGDAVERFTTAVLAHEIGHVLGGEHELATSNTNLMRATINRANFNDANFVPDFSEANAAEITASELLFLSPVTAIPLPATLPALLGGLFLIAGLRWRRIA